MITLGTLNKFAYLFKIENVDPARDQLERQHYDSTDLMAIIPSHMHWDHASGLEDFKEVPIWIQKVSHDEALHGQPPGFVLSQYDDKELQWHYLDITNSEYEGFAKKIKDQHALSELMGAKMNLEMGI